LLLLGLFPSVLGRLMMTDYAAGAGADNAVMPGIVPRDSADGGALQAAGRLRRNPAGRTRSPPIASTRAADQREIGRKCRFDNVA